MPSRWGTWPQLPGDPVSSHSFFDFNIRVALRRDRTRQAIAAAHHLATWRWPASWRASDAEGETRPERQLNSRR